MGEVQEITIYTTPAPIMMQFLRFGVDFSALSFVSEVVSSWYTKHKMNEHRCGTAFDTYINESGRFVSDGPATRRLQGSFGG